jgi:hypothetical protein
MRLTSAATLAALAMSAVLLTASPSSAQSSPQAQAPARAIPDEASITAARQLGDRLDFNAQAHAMVASLRNQVAFTFARASGKSRDEALKTVDEVIMPDYANVAPELVAVITEAWASTFTADELRELQRFYGTPLGAKLQRNGGQMTQLVTNSSRVLMQGILTKSLQTHDAELKARGLKN